MKGKIQVIPNERKMRSIANKILPTVIQTDGYLTSKPHCFLSWKWEFHHLYKIALSELVFNMGNKIALRIGGTECWLFWGFFKIYENREYYLSFAKDFNSISVFLGKGKERIVSSAFKYIHSTDFCRMVWYGQSLLHIGAV